MPLYDVSDGLNRLTRERITAPSREAAALFYASVTGADTADIAIEARDGEALTPPIFPLRRFSPVDAGGEGVELTVEQGEVYAKEMALAAFEGEAQATPVPDTAPGDAGSAPDADIAATDDPASVEAATSEARVETIDCVTGDGSGEPLAPLADTPAESVDDQAVAEAAAP